MIIRQGTRNLTSYLKVPDSTLTQYRYLTATSPRILAGSPGNVLVTGSPTFPDNLESDSHLTSPHLSSPLQSTSTPYVNMVLGSVRNLAIPDATTCTPAPLHTCTPAHLHACKLSHIDDFEITPYHSAKAMSTPASCGYNSRRRTIFSHGPRAGVVLPRCALC